ncbi:MAG: Peptidase BlaR1 [Sphingomonas bacterium]|uniref:M56 family metallopeptidase n=1 Tax=Sphingomonas bacterium TaxID=1895847 RepID=UPI00262D23B7|nr:M56 family metallopeptidase [Sphingomonas bacterium]MDB5703319.1 Peptidase BlaR1 [Sphingomonas bacterium]
MALAVAQYGFAPALASALLHSLWQNALLAMAAALALRAMARATAASRHNVAMAFLVAMVIGPAVQFLRFWQQTGTQIDNGLFPAMTAPRLSAAANAFVQDSSVAGPAVILFWLLGVGLMMMRHVIALRALTAIERHPYQLLPPPWRQRVDEMRGALGITRAVAVRLSDDVLMPFAARLLRPAIWLPLSLLTRAPADQIEALLAHELAHIARKDWLWNGVQFVIESLLFFHPAMWWLGRRIRQEREHAGDDLAVAACGDAIALAEALVALERERHSSPRLVLAANGGSLMHRITRLLSGPPSRGRWGALAILGTLTISGAVLITQMGLAGGRFPDLQVTASTAGALGPGDYREIKAGGLDKQRYYRESIDAQGRRTQVYEENGKAHPIDAGVTSWIAGVTRLSLRPLPMAAAPQIDQMAESKALFALVAANRDVVATVGSPAVPTSRPVNGNLHHDGTNGAADISVEMRGPKGQALVAVKAEMSNRVWTLHKVDVE